MSSWKLADLPWLVPAPADFKARIDAIKVKSDDRGPAIQKLALHNLNTNQLTQLGKLIGNDIRSGNDLSPLVPIRIGVLSNATACLVGPVLVGAAARHGVALDLFIAPYDQVTQQAFDPASELNREKRDVVLLMIDHRALPLGATVPGDAAAEQSAVGAAYEHLCAILDGIRNGCGAPVIVQTMPRMPQPLFGSFDHVVSGTHSGLMRAINDRIGALIKERGDYLLDIAALAETVGLDVWHNPQHWNMYKLPFDQTLVPLYADHVARLCGAIRGRSRKCLVLDLDNTLWGGVIGDDGLDGIVVGQGDAAGESFLEVQRTALALRQRGIILAVCSKNDDVNARKPFREHPDMLLHEDDIAVFVANWDDKASNLEVIARDLNIGLDALVMLDDNPAERAQVRAALPMVAVPELPADPAYYSRTLLAAGYFETVSFSREDLSRSDQYQANAKRTAHKTQARDLTSYLKSLDMKITFARFDAIGRGRISQLINKSNQFNLTTRRYTEAEVAAMEKDPKLITMQVRLSDSFGDNGMISVLICRDEGGGAWAIDTWLMSCRVLGRRVEQAALAELVRVAASRGAKKLIGRFIPSGRNELVREHYSKLGFSPEGMDGDHTLWTLDVASYQSPELPMTVVREDFADAA